jgi:hypothetical protein
MKEGQFGDLADTYSAFLILCQPVVAAYGVVDDARGMANGYRNTEIE